MKGEALYVQGAVAVAALSLTYWILCHRRPKAHRRRDFPNSGYVRPPFPGEITRLLDSAHLCYLSTSQNDSPHLSLMNFTYNRDTQQIIFTTRRNTRKCQQLQHNNSVAILVHDFPSLRNQMSKESYGEASFSITLYGKATVLSDCPESEAMKEFHRQHSPAEARPFIQGQGIAVVAIDVEYARICDAQDKVYTWRA